MFCWAAGKLSASRPIVLIWAAPLSSMVRPPGKEAMARIKAPIYGFYASNDARIDATLPDTTAQMKAAGKTFEPVVYDGAGHGFMRAGEAPDANDANKKAGRTHGRAGRISWANNSGEKGLKNNEPEETARR